MKKIKIDDWKPFEIEKLFTVKRPKSRSVKNIMRERYLLYLLEIIIMVSIVTESLLMMKI